MSYLSRLHEWIRRRSVQRSALALLVACGVALGSWLTATKLGSARANARLNSAAERLDSLMDRSPADAGRRVAIAWGYAERLRLGLESPFRLIEAAGRDPRLTSEERRTVAWALLAHVTRGETHSLDAAALDGLGPLESGRSAAGERHLALIRQAVATAANPRAAELAVRFAYTLAVSERLVDPSAPMLVAEAAAMIGDGEIARREARDVVRSAHGVDLIAVVRHRRERRAFYVERPTLLAPSEDLERTAIALAPVLLDAIRVMRPVTVADSSRDNDGPALALAPRLYAAGARVPPAAPLAVTVQRYMPMLRAHAPRLDHDALARARNAEMLVGVTRVRDDDGGRQQRRAVGRLLLAAGVSMRSMAQEPVWFATDPVPDAVQTASALGVHSVTFDRDVPTGWRPYYLQSLANGVRDLRRVLPSLRLDELHVRFRAGAPSDSALAMHDPRTRTLHLPVITAGGTLSHEIAHDLDRRSAQEQGLAGYRSDIAARENSKPTNQVGAPPSAEGRLAASLLALAEEGPEPHRTVQPRTERPAEIFATGVDWFVASKLAVKGISNGFLSGVQDELLTGHVVHPDRLRTSNRSRSLLTAIEGMTAVAPFASQDDVPSVQALLRWSLAGPVDRGIATAILAGATHAWMPASLIGDGACRENDDARVALVRLAAESRARGWLRSRARWTPDGDRTPWARATLRQAPWSGRMSEQRVAALRDYILVSLASEEELPAGLAAYAAPLAARARCR